MPKDTLDCAVWAKKKLTSLKQKYDTVWNGLPDEVKSLLIAKKE